jgi:hypothetical protein
MITAIEEIARRVCDIPSEFHRRGDVSVVALVEQSGYDDSNAPSLRQAIEQQLCARPAVIEDWLCYSADKRTSRGWYFQDDPVLVVAYFESGVGTSRERRFTDRAQACAEFIMRELESIREPTV